MSEVNLNKINILISAEGGQGGQILGKILAETAFNSHFEVSMLPHYGVEKRGGISLAYLCISNEKIANPRFDRADVVTISTWRQISIPEKYITKNTILINGMAIVEKLKELGRPLKTLNMVILGVLVWIANNQGITLDSRVVEKNIKKSLGKKPGLKDNLEAFKFGLNLSPDVYNRALDEIKKPKFEPIINDDAHKTHVRFPYLCKGCGLCIEKCPVKALSGSTELNFISKPVPAVDMQKCTACGICQNICPDCAILVTRKSKNKI